MSTHTNPTIEELDALEQGSIALVLDGPDDKYPEVYTRWATGWKHCTSSKNVPHSALLTHPEQIVKVVSDTADQKGGIPVSSTVEALGALPEGTLVRHINRRAHPVGWVFPGIVRRVQATGFRGVELHDGPVPLEWVAGYDHELTVIWSPQPEADVSAGPDLQQLKESAKRWSTVRTRPRVCAGTRLRTTDGEDHTLIVYAGPYHEARNPHMGGKFWHFVTENGPGEVLGLPVVLTGIVKEYYAYSTGPRGFHADFRFDNPQEMLEFFEKFDCYVNVREDVMNSGGMMLDMSRLFPEILQNRGEESRAS